MVALSNSMLFNGMYFPVGCECDWYSGSGGVQHRGCDRHQEEEVSGCVYDVLLVVTVLCIVQSAQFSLQQGVVVHVAVCGCTCSSVWLQYKKLNQQTHSTPVLPPSGDTFLCA